MLDRGMDEGNREARHSDECRLRMEAKIRDDPAQRHRLEAADRRRDEELARELEKGVEPEVAQEKPPEDKKESALGEKRPAEEEAQEEIAEEIEDHEFDLPEVSDEPIAKRARVGSRNRPTQEQEATVGADEEPAQKRAREVMVTWADGIECATCGRSFASRNQLF